MPRHYKRRSSRRPMRKPRVSRKAVTKIVKEVAMSRLDSKVHNMNGSSTLLTSISSVNLVELNKIPEGTTNLTRTGESCFLRSLHIKFQITPQQQGYVRIMILTPKRGSLVLTTLTDQPSLIRNDADLIGGQFNVHYDKLFGLDSLTDLKLFEYQLRYPKGGRKITFRASGEAKVPMYLWMLGSNASTGPTVFYQSRLWFKDEDS